MNSKWLPTDLASTLEAAFGFPQSEYDDQRKPPAENANDIALSVRDAVPFQLPEAAKDAVARGPQDAPAIRDLPEPAAEKMADMVADKISDAASGAPVDKIADLLGRAQDALSDWQSVEAYDLVLHHHTCGCMACSADREEPTEEDATGTGSDENGTATGGETAGNVGIMSDMADFLLTGYWNTGYGDGTRSHNVTSSGIDANNGVLHYNLSGYGADADGVTEERAFLIREAFKLFESTLGIEFVETTSTDSNLVDFFFRDNDGGAYASHSYWNSGEWGSTITSAQINVAAGWSGGTSTYDDYTFQTILHEIGHAMGLGHQGPYNGSASYGTDNVFANDNWQSSMMSYFSQTQATAVDASYEFLQTPMAVDWIALDEIYGRQGYGTENAFVEDTIWGFNTTVTSEVSDVWASWSDWGQRTASTLVDGGGIDTLDLSGYSNNTLINLAPTDLGGTSPSTSDIGGRIGNLTIATGTIIENAIGGAGSETFFGNDADNTLQGNGGDDTFYDSIGSDTYIGGAGTDYVTFGAAFADFTYSLVGGVLQVIDQAIDWVDDTVEWLTFSDQTLSWQAIAGGTTSNDAPVANADAYVVGEDQTLNAGSVLANDTDADGDALSVAQVEGAAVDADGTTVELSSGATVTMFADGTFSYNQNGAFDALNVGQQATDSFTYRATDGAATSSNQTVTITINGAFDNGAPVTAADAYTVNEDATLNATSVLANDADPEGDALSVTRIEGAAVNVDGTTVTLSSGASVTMFADGTFSYNQNGAFDALNVGQQATDSFSYRASDGESASGDTTVTITINGTFDNAAPVAVNDAFRLDESDAINGSVLANDTDANGDTLNVTALNGSAAQIGVAQTLESGALLTLNADGTFSYDTNGAFAALETGQTETDSFSYTISDGRGGSDTAQVTLTIDGVSPSAVTQNVLIDFEGEASGTYAGNYGLAFEGVSVVSTNSISGAQAGASDSNGNFTITAESGEFDLNSLRLISQSGRQTVWFEAYDDGALVGSMKVRISTRRDTEVNFDTSFDGVDQIVVSGSSSFLFDDLSLITRMPMGDGPNAAPIAVNDVFSTNEADPVSINLLSNDSDPNGDTLTLSAIEGAGSGPVTLASGATVTFLANGQISYDPNGAFSDLFAGQTASDSFVYTVSDGQGGESQGTASITIAGQGTPPAPTVVDLENAVQTDFATVADDTFIFNDAVLTDAATGVVSGGQAVASIDGNVEITRLDGETFDLEQMYVTLSGTKRQEVSIEGYLDGEFVGSQSSRLRGEREQLVELSDEAFDNVDTVIVRSANGVILDDLIFIV